jgi:hypothetical protein
MTPVTDLHDLHGYSQHPFHESLGARIFCGGTIGYGTKYFKNFEMNDNEFQITFTAPFNF